MRAIWPTVAAQSARLGRSRCLRASTKPARLPVEQHIDRKQSGDAGRNWRIRRKPPGRGQHMEDVARQHLKQEGEEETRRHRAEDRDEPHQIVHPSVLLGGRDHAERNADKERNRDRRQNELESRREGFGDVVVDRALGEKGEPEVAARQPDDEMLVLLDERLVETHLPLEVVDLLLARARSHRHSGRIARHDARDHEDHDREPEQHESRPERAPDQKVQEFQLTFSSLPLSGAPNPPSCPAAVPLPRFAWEDGALPPPWSAAQWGRVDRAQARAEGRASAAALRKGRPPRSHQLQVHLYLWNA